MCYSVLYFVYFNPGITVILSVLLGDWKGIQPMMFFYGRPIGSRPNPEYSVEEQASKREA